MSVAELRGVLIDLDGTLMDTAPDLAAAANRMRADFGLPPLPLERVAAFVGKGAEVLVHRALTERTSSPNSWRAGPSPTSARRVPGANRRAHSATRACE